MAESTGDERLLRKYRDWCSARLAEHFLQLTPEEIFQLASEAPPETEHDRWVAAAGDGPANRSRTEPGPVDVDPVAPPAVAASATYRNLIERVTEVLAGRLHLPTFEEWTVAYAEDPTRFDRELWHGTENDEDG